MCDLLYIIRLYNSDRSKEILKRNDKPVMLRTKTNVYLVLLLIRLRSR